MSWCCTTCGGAECFPSVGLLEPAALLLAALALPIILFYMLRLRRQEITISSSMLWRQVTQDRQANAPWQKLRRNLLLYLQLLALALLAVALARPFVESGGLPAGAVVVIIDGSASMQAQDGADSGGPITRFARAQDEAARLVDGLAPGARMTVILAGATPRAVVSAGQDKAALRAAIAALRPGAGLGDLSGAVTLAAATAPAPGATLVVISDGAIGDGRLPAVSAAVRYIGVGHSAENSAITALALRDAPQGPQLFVGLANTGPAPAGGLLTVEVDGRAWDSRRVDLAAGADDDLTLPDLPIDTRLVTVTLKIADPLPLDNTAWAARTAGGAVRTLVVSDSAGFIEKAINLLPQARLSRVAPADYRPDAPADLTVFDGALPATLPPGPLLLINPPDSPLLPISGTVAYPVVGPADATDPLLRYVDLSGLHLAEARHALAPAWARVLLRSTAGDPLILAGEPGGRRVVALTFDLHRSDLPLQVAFPILMANVVGWLAPGSAVEAPPRLLPGAPLAIHPVPEADTVLIDAPADGQQAARRFTIPAGAAVSFAETAAPGLYRVRQTAQGRPVGADEWFAINLLDRAESDIAPRPTIDLQGQPVARAQSVSGRREVGPLLLALAMLLLLLEWRLYHQGARGLLRRMRPHPR
jgi:Ca-activated chloride channel homolog